MSAAGYRYLAIFLWCFFPLVGVALGLAFLVIALGVAFVTKDDYAQLFFFLALCPLSLGISTGLGIWLGLKSWRKAGHPE
jgi:hypothetical protein